MLQLYLLQEPHYVKSWKGSFNNTHGATLGGHVVKHAAERAQINMDEIEDVIFGCADPEGATGLNIARQIAIRSGAPVTVPGMTINRFCSSGLQSVALAAQRVISGEGKIFVAGGVESISCVQNPKKYSYVEKKTGLLKINQSFTGICYRLLNKYLKDTLYLGKIKTGTEFRVRIGSNCKRKWEI